MESARKRDDNSAFSHMEKQTNNSWLAVNLYKVRQAK